MAIALPPRPTKKITSQRITPIFTTPSDASVPWSPRPGRPQGYELPPQISGCSSWKNSYVGKKRKVRTPPGTPRGVGPPPDQGYVSDMRFSPKYQCLQGEKTDILCWRSANYRETARIDYNLVLHVCWAGDRKQQRVAVTSRKTQ